MTPVIVFVPAGTDVARWTMEIIDYCAAHDYVPRSLVRHWHEVEQLLRDNQAQVVVVATRRHLPADRLPRIESVDEHRRRAAAAKAAGQRRPQRLT